MSLETYQQITRRAADELRRAADRFEQITAEADAQVRAALEKWEAEMREQTRED